MTAVRLVQKELLEGLPAEWCTVQFEAAGENFQGRLKSGSNLFLDTRIRLRHRQSVRVTVSTRWGRLTFQTSIRANLGLTMFALAWPRHGILLPSLRGEHLRLHDRSNPAQGTPITGENEAA